MIRSMLFLPGNSPSLLANADILGADAIIFDLEDAVSPDEKDAARVLVRNALPLLKRPGLQTIVRINPVDALRHWREDIKAILPEAPDFFMPTKVSGAAMLTELTAFIKSCDPNSTVRIIPLIETALGIENAFQIASAPLVQGVLLGAEDLTSDLRCVRTKKGDEIFYARTRVVMAARAAGVEPYDTPFTDVLDDQGLIEDAERAKALGFSGKASISPRHVADINRAFSPTQADIDYAHEVLLAIEQGKREGRGAVSLRGKMIDLPIVNRAKQVLEAEALITGNTGKGGALA